MSQRAQHSVPSFEPSAERRQHTWRRPTGDVDDPWAWMRNTADPAFIKYLESENVHTNAWFSALEDTTQTIFSEIVSRVQETDNSAPVRYGDWWYVSRTVEGLSYQIHCRAHSAVEANTEAAEILLDQNALAEGYDFFDLGAFEPDPSHRFLAWSADVDGNEHYTLRIRDTTTGQDLADIIPDTTWGGIAWSQDASELFYVVADDTERPFEVRRHTLGTGTETDAVVWSEPDERFYVGIGTTRSGRYLVIHSSSKTTSEVHLIPTDSPRSSPTCVRPRVEGVDYSVDDWGHSLVVLTNFEAEDFMVATAPHEAPEVWTPLVPHTPGRRITSLEPFSTTLAIHSWSNAEPTITLLGIDGTTRVIDMGDEPHDIEFGPNENFECAELRVHTQSLTRPATVVDISLDDLSHRVVKTTPTPGVNLDDYVASRYWATADDGTKVPYDIVRRRDTTTAAPTVVYAYGSYEVSLPPWFSVARLSLLDRGVNWMLVHPRGGGELGRRWYLEGKLLNKRHTFTDVIATTRDAIERGLADPKRIGIRGGSAGGLMVGACVTLEPSLYTSAVAEVPFVDVVSTMSDPTLPLTVTEWDEWGDPRTEPFATYIESYSPYDNTAVGDYPALLITAGLNDPRVSVHEPAKWTAKLRALRTNDRPLLLRTEMGAGHAGPSGRYSAWREEAQTLTFLLDTL